jgi:hypothetical protein
MTYNIEVGQQTEHKMSYDDAVLYIFCLGDGWRLPTVREYSYDKINNSWWLNDNRRNLEWFWYATPVRDLQ